MKKTVYIQPLIESVNAETEQFIAASPATGTSIPDLPVDNTPTDEDGRVRGILDAFFE